MDLCRAFDALQDHAANSNHLCGQWHSMVDQVKTMSSSEARKAMVVKEEGLSGEFKARAGPVSALNGRDMVMPDKQDTAGSSRDRFAG
eukprot:1209797-Rhodomonas_salina.2